MNTTSLAETITYTTECRTINPKTIDANNYKDFCENFDCYELIPDDRKIKPYFDIEIKPKHCNEGQEYVKEWDFVSNIAIQQLEKYFDNPKVVILNASSEKYISCEDGEEKWITSLHLIITNYKMSKKQCGIFVKLMNKEYDKQLKMGNELNGVFNLKPGFTLFDESVYDPNRKIRSAFANKTHFNPETNKVIRETGRPLIIENNGLFEDTVISAFFDPLITEIADAIELPILSLENPTSPTSVVQLTEEEVSLNDIDYLLCVCIQDKMCKDECNKEWTIIGQALKNELADDATQPFLNWTYKFGTENKKKEALLQITKYIKKTPLKDKKRVTISTIHYYARLNNESKYKARFFKKKLSSVNNKYEKYIDEILFNNNDYAMATYFYKKWGDNFKCIDIKNKLYYGYTTNALWESFDCGTKIREIISNEMANDFKAYQNKLVEEQINYEPADENHEKIERKIKALAECYIKLGKTNDKNNITREITDKIFDDKFENTLNKSKYLLPIKNKKVFNMKTLTTVDRTIEHAFSYECDANYVELTEEEDLDIKKYFLELFCGNEKTMNCVINILKSLLSGDTLRYIFFFTGDGSNGKSLLFKVLISIFKGFMDTIDTKVILETKQSSNLTTEFEKLDKTRLGYITELKATDTLNTTTIKKITGGDAIDCRGLFKTNKTINPTCNLCVLTNVLPNFEAEKAIMNRIVVVPLNNNFPIDSSFETKLLEKRDLIFSFIMKHGTICDKFDLTDEMLVAKENYQDDNVKDYLGEFIKSNYDMVDFVKTERFQRDVFRIAYNAYLKENNAPFDKSSNVKFTRIIRNYKIGVQESNGKTYYTGLKIKPFIDE
jgi:P4 family phage/plasmid primase-like protien